MRIAHYPREKMLEEIIGVRTDNLLSERKKLEEIIGVRTDNLLSER